MTERAVFEAQLLLSSNLPQFKQEFRQALGELRQEASRQIAGPQGARGLSARVSSAQGRALGSVDVLEQRGVFSAEQATAARQVVDRGFRQVALKLEEQAARIGRTFGGISQGRVDIAQRALIQAVDRHAAAEVTSARQAQESALADRAAATEARRVRLLAARAAGATPSDLAARRQALTAELGYDALRPKVPTAPPVQPPRQKTSWHEETQAEEAARIKARAPRQISAEGIDPSRAAEIIRAQSIKTQTAQELAASKEYVQAKAAEAVALRHAAQSIKEETIRQSGGQPSQGSLFQRLQSFVASRKDTTGASAGRLPAEFQTFGQFFTSKALTTAGFALSGAALYSAVSGFKEIIREASELQRQLAIVQGTFDGLGDSKGFANFRQQVIAISLDTGVAADQVALVARQLSGVFTDATTGAADFNKALSETKVALKLQQVTGLPTQEITDSLTAITSTFGTSFQEIGDTAIGLEQRFGVLSTQIIQFTADLAPTAKELGFTVQQIAALGAIAQQRSGVSGGALAENFNRSLPAIRDQVSGLVGLLDQKSSTKGFIKPLIDDLRQGNGAAVLSQLTAAFQLFDEAQRNALAKLLGGQRNAKAFFAVLQGGKQTIDALNSADPAQFAGKLDDRFKRFRETVDFAFSQAQRAAEEFGLALFNAGLADILRDIAVAGGVLAKVATELLTVFTTFNDILGGIPGRLLAVYAAIRLIVAARGVATGVGGAFRQVTGRVAAETAEGVGATGVSGFLGANSGVVNRSVTNSPLLRRVANVQNIAIPAGSLPGGAPVALGGGFRTGLANAMGTLAPALAATALASLASTIQGVQSAMDDARKDLTDQVGKKIAEGANPNTILANVSSLPGANDTPTLPFDLPGNPISGLLNKLAGTDVTLNSIGLDATRGANAPRQIEELKAIVGTKRKEAEVVLAELQKDHGLINGIGVIDNVDQLLQFFSEQPTNDSYNTAVAQIIASFASSGLPELKAIAEKYAIAAKGNQATQAQTDYAPTLAEIRSNFESGNASLDQLVVAEGHNVELLKQALEGISDPTQRATQLDKIAAAEKQQDDDVDKAATRASTLATRLSKLKGGSSKSSAVAAAASRLATLQKYNVAPDRQTDAALDLLDAKQAKFEEDINALVNGPNGAREATAAEKLARAQAGSDIAPALRDAIIKSSLKVSDNSAAIAKVSEQTGKKDDFIIDAVANLVQGLDQAKITILRNILQAHVDEAKRFLSQADTIGTVESAQEFLGAQDALNQAQAGLDALNQLGTKAGESDPGTKIFSDTTDLQRQVALDATAEARALAESLNAVAQAQANGDPVALAQASIAAAQGALARAEKPSERQAAIAQIINAQNQLADAQNAIITAQLDYAENLNTDPVSRASYEFSKAQHAVATAKGVAAQYAALAQQTNAQRELGAAIVDVIRSQQELVTAIADAAGDTVGAAQSQLQIARLNLQNLLDRKALGDDPGQAAINRAKVEVIRAQAGTRDADLQKRESDIDFALQMEQITTQQALAQFQALLQIPNLTVEQTRAILLKIKQLKGELGQDLQFNLPTEIKLPTLYEVRRLSQSGTPGAPGGYNDNRQQLFTIQIYNAGDLDGAVQTIINATNGPPRNGVRVPYGS